jgi:hypothetical protein
LSFSDQRQVHDISIFLGDMLGSDFQAIVPGHLLKKFLTVRSCFLFVFRTLTQKAIGSHDNGGSASGPPAAAWRPSSDDQVYLQAP